ncbi:MAG: hypothetical protein KAT65_01700 [Methanophagales archaeon]|nr:hypothetical protein [Methanophagales archaeon]
MSYEVMAVEYFKRRLKKYLLTIYAKAKREEISIKEIKEALNELDMGL